MSASYPPKLRLAFRSGDRCAFPGCDKALTVDAEPGCDPTVIGVAVHIAGEKPRAARYDKTMTADQRDQYDNLIYVCPNHHVIIDDQEANFPVERLLAMKAEHEAKVREAMNEAFAQVGFQELALATEWMARMEPRRPSSDYVVTDPDAKIRKNELSNASRVTITMGLALAKEVRAFIENEAMVDIDFPERLRAGFLEEYFRLRKEGHKGDDLFDLMSRFAQRGQKEQAKRSAGVAVLVYLFEACEVFEK
jgi:hypothetical protein